MKAKTSTTDMCKAKQVATCRVVEAKIKDCLIKGQAVIRDTKGGAVQLDPKQTGIFEVMPNLADHDLVDLEEGHYDFRTSHARVCKSVNGDGIMSGMAILNGSFTLSFDSKDNIIVKVDSVAVVRYLN